MGLREWRIASARCTERAGASSAKVCFEPEGDIETHTDTVHRKIVGVPWRVKHQVATALARGTADARDPGVQKKTLAGNDIVMARAGSTARVGRPLELPQGQHIEGVV